MQKLQILFPDPIMRKLRAVSQAEDRPVSEIVRRAVERLLMQRTATPPTPKPSFPVFHGGGVLVSASHLKQEIYSDDQ